MADFADMPIERRLVEAGAIFVATLPLLAALDIRGRDDDRVITPQDEEAKTPRLILVASDQGRTKPYAPIRNLQLRLTLRANTKAPEMSVARFDALCAALERLLDNTNLKAALDSVTLPVALRVMHAVRQPGCESLKHGQIHSQRYAIDVKAVPAERVAS